MQLPNPKDARHKGWLYRTLSSIADDPFLASLLAFKGGTCAAMLGFLDRFSVDLDFDYRGKEHSFDEARAHLESIFADLNLVVKDKSPRIPQYFLRYSAPDGERNTLKIDMSFPPVAGNIYEAKRLIDIDRIFTCQTIETMFANKLVSLIDRFHKSGSIAGRDLYDIHFFFENSHRYTEAVILERAQKPLSAFFEDLIAFIEQQVTDGLLAEDLNALVPPETFRRIRKTLKQETLVFLRDELARQNNEGSVH